MKCLALLAALALPGIAQDENPIRWSFADPAPRSPAAAGATLKLRVQAEITEGWHLYSLVPLEGGPIPTKIWLPEGQPFTHVGAVDAPPPRVVHDPNFDMQVGYYDGDPVFTLRVKTAPDAPQGKHTLKVNARYQACNDNLCLPPKTVPLEMTIEVKK